MWTVLPVAQYLGRGVPRMGLRQPIDLAPQCLT
jgi:hypothetical protein